MTKASRLIVISFLLLLFTVTASPQSTSSMSGVTGVVTDSAGAVIAGVAVTLIDTKTSKELSTTTNDQGIYQFVQVPPGNGYKLVFSTAGFQKFEKTDVSLGVGVVETHNAQLSPGQVSETVTVSSAGEVTLNTSDASIGNVIDEKRLRELPIAVRNSPASLIGLQPGVVGSNVGTTSTNRVGSVTGARADQGNIVVDGIDANDQATGQFAATVGNAPIDSIQEFRAVTTNPSASAGRSSGGQVDLITKSGSNDFHGNLREYNRTAFTAANTFFNNKAGLPRPQLTRNQFGGSLGGPIIKEKIFFFFDYEGRREARGISYLRVVPLDSYRKGNLGYINNTAGCATNSRQNTTPACISFLTPAQVAALDPKHVGASQEFLTFINSRYPQANDLTAGDGINTGGFRFNAPVSRVENTETTRIDWNITQAQRLFGRFTIARGTSTDTVNSVAAQFPGDSDPPSIRQEDYSWVVGHTWNPTPNIVNQAIVGVAHSGLLFPRPFQPTFPNLFGAPDSADPGGSFGPLSAPFPDISIQSRVIPVPTIRDDLTWSRGKHTFAFGGSIKPWKSVSTLINDLNFVGIGLGGNLTALDSSLRPADIRPGTTASTNFDNAFPFLLGRYAQIATNFVYDTSGKAQAPGTGKTRDFRYTEYEFYGQDNWRVTSSLTLTAGLRWQYYTAPYEANGFQSCNDVDFEDLYNLRIRNAAAGIASNSSEPILHYDLCGKKNNGRAIYEPDRNNFAPRFNFAWNPTFKDGLLGKVFGDRSTVLRGGGSVVYDHIATTITFVQDQLSYLFDNSATTNFGSEDASDSLLTDPRFTSLTSLPAQNTAPAITRPFTPFVDGGVPIGNGLGQLNYTLDQHFRIPYSIQYSVGFQRSLPGDFIVSLDYVGRQGRKLFMEADAAQVLDFKDPDSGQFMLAALRALQAQLVAGVAPTAVTNQPWIENQISAAVGAPCAVLPRGSCTRFLAGTSLNTLIAQGNTTNLISALVGNGLLNPNVGMSGQFASNLYISNQGSSTYNGMLLSIRKRFSAGLQFDFNYTWQHSIDNQSSVVNTVLGGIVCDLRDLRSCRGNSDFDIRHLWNANWIYDLPFGKGRMFGSHVPGPINAVVGGWSVTGIFTARGGLPFSASTGSFPVGLAYDFPRGTPPLLTGAGSLEGAVHNSTGGTIQFFADRSAALAALGFPVHGAMGGSRNFLRGPKFWNVDLAVLKNFAMPWSEKQSIQLRWEMFNAFNHNNFGLPNVSITSSSFGNITSSATTASAREMQFALRYQF